jgi:hypothetical protein
MEILEYFWNMSIARAGLATFEREMPGHMIKLLIADLKPFSPTSNFLYEPQIFSHCARVAGAKGTRYETYP